MLRLVTPPDDVVTFTLPPLACSTRVAALSPHRHAHLFSLITALSHMASLFYLVRRVQTTLRITDGAYSVLQFRQRGRPGEVVTVRVENL